MTPNRRPKLRSSLFWGFELGAGNVLDSLAEWLGVSPLSPTLDSLVEWLAGLYLFPSVDSSVLFGWDLGTENELERNIGLSLEVKKENVLNRSISLSLETRKENVLDRLISLSLETPRNNVLTSSLGAEYTVVDTRYFTSNPITYKAISCRTLETTPSTSSEARGILSAARFGIRVWKSDASDTETEITSGTPLATVIYVDDGWYDANFACPETALTLTDKIVVRVYASKLIPTSWSLLQTFVSEALGASKLNPATWAIHYWLEASGSTVNFWYGGAVVKNSRITNFRYTHAV